jgi:hypothetical protein
MNQGIDIAISLILGLLVAAALQLVLTNLGIALGLSLVDWSAGGEPKQESQPDSGSLPITHLAGFGIALSVSLVLFVASLLTTEFSQIVEPRRGAVFGITLWSAYWVLLFWFSSTWLLGLANAIWGTAIASSRQLIATARQLLRPQSSQSSNIDQALLHDLAEEVSQMADLQRQLPDLLAQQRETLIAEIAERTDLSTSEAESVVAELDSDRGDRGTSFQSSPSSGLLSSLDLPSWQQLVRQLLNRVDLSSLDVETLWQQLQSLQNEQSTQPPSQNDVICLDAEDYIRQTPRWCLQPEIIEADFYERIYDPEAAPDQVKEQLGKLTRTDFVDWLQQRGDLAAEHVQSVADHLSQVQQTVMEQVTSSSTPERSTAALQKAGQGQVSLRSTEPSPAVQAMEDKLLAYCRYTNLDLLTPDSLTEKVETLRQELDLSPEQTPLAQSGMDVASLTDVLARRQGMETDQHQTLTDALTQALGNGASPPKNPARSEPPEHLAHAERSDHLATSEDAEHAEQPDMDEAWLQQARHRLEDYFQSVDWSAVSLEDIKPEVMSQLQSLDLRGELDWKSLSHHLQVPDEVKTDLVDWLQETGGRLSKLPRRWAIRVGQSTQDFVQYLIRQITRYLRFQEKSAFQPEQIAQDLAEILKTAVAILPNPSDWEILSNLQDLVDLDSLRAALESRQDMTVEQIQQVLGWFESAWQATAHQALTWTQTLWSGAQEWLSTETDNLDSVRRGVVEQIAQAQQTVQAKAAQVKADLQNQADAVRKQIAIAAWWIFLSLVSSAGAAAAAGWLAVRYG